MNDLINISAIEPQKKKKGRYNIFVEGEYFCSLGADSLIVFSIKEGNDISESKLNEAVLADNTQYAFDSAVNLISFKMRTKGEIREKLLSKKIDENAINSAIEKLESYGYVDDTAYAVEFVNSSVSGARYGKKVVEYKLKQKGLSDDIIENATQNYSSDDELRIAKKHYNTLQKKYESEDIMKKRQKIYSNLLRRGFSYDVINTVIGGDDNFE